MSIDNKLDKIQEDVNEIKTHLAVYNEQLTVHIKRSEMLEDRIIPIETHVFMINGAIKLIGIVAAVAAIVEVFIKAKG